MAQWPYANGDMAARVRAFDWAASPLGPVERWPHSLRATVELLLGHAFPVALVWGPANVTIYNDAYASLLGRRHPATLGRPIHDVWPEVYEINDGFFRRVRAGETVALRDANIRSRRNGDMDDAWFDLSISPVRDDDGDIAGILFTGFDTTERVRTAAARTRRDESPEQAEARQSFLLELSDTLRPLADPHAIMATASEALGRHLRVGRCGYGEVDPAGDYFSLLHSWNDGVMRSSSGLQRLGDFGEALLAEYKSGRNVVIDDVRADPRSAATHSAYTAAGGVRASLAVPLIKDGRWVAVFYVQQAAPRAWSPAEEDLVREVADRTWGAVERARAMACLRASEARHRAVFDSVDDGIFLLERLPPRVDGKRDYRFVAMNPAMQSMFGLPDLSGQSLRDNFPGSAEDWYDDYDLVLETGQPMRFQRASAIKPIIVETFLTRVEDGSGRRLLAVMQDVTERQRAQTALRENESRLRAFVAASTDCLCRMSADFSEVRSFEGKPFEGVAGEATGGWLDRFFLSEDHDHIRAVLADALSRKAMFELEHRVQLPDGTITWLQSRVVPIFDDHGAIVEWFVSSSNVSARKEAERALRESEEQYRVLFESIDEGFCVIETLFDVGGTPIDYRFVQVNPAFERQTGLVGAVGRTVRELVPTIEPYWYGLYGRIALSGEPTRFEHRADGLRRWFEGYAFRIGQPEERRVAVLFRDILPRKRAEAALRENEERLRRALETEQVLVAELQHRTRNLLGVVRAMADKTMARALDLTDFRGRFGDRLDALARVQSLLSQLREGERVTFDELVRSEMAAHGGDTDRIALEGPYGVAMRSSTVQTFALALHELATNAVKYGALSQPAGRLTIRWHLERADADGIPWLYMEWRERGVDVAAAAAPAAGGGAGRELIERALPYQLGARTTYVLALDGVHCTIALPVSRRQPLPVPAKVSLSVA